MGMRWWRDSLRAAVLIGATAAAAMAAQWRGAISGVLAVPGAQEAAVPWDLAWANGELVLKAARAGFEVELAIRPPGLAGAAGSWRVVRGRIDLGEAWPEARGWLGAESWSASGVVELAGEGTFAADGTPRGEVRVELRDGWARDDAAGLALGGVTMQARLVATSAGWSSPPDQSVRVERIDYAGYAATAGELRFELGEDKRLRIAGGSVRVLGGRAELRPLVLDLANPGATVTVELSGVDLGELAALAPWLMGGAAGRLAGRVEVAWSTADGVELRGGALRVERSDGATFRLAPAPGLLSGGVPQRFLFLPRWLGAWTERVGPKNPMYDAVRAVETGAAGLRIEELRVDLRPAGGADGRSAALSVRARPVGVELVEELTLDVNFYGSLAEAIALGIDERVRIQIR